MPITRKQFELEIDPQIEGRMKEIDSFLSQHKDEAFSRNEVWEALSVSDKTEEWEAALDKLVELGTVEKRIIRATDYYSCKEVKKPRTKRSSWSF